MRRWKYGEYIYRGGGRGGAGRRLNLIKINAWLHHTQERCEALM